ncbi:5-formyltetrahydrofolate cyclo-ligase [Mongoliitalea daihaiensis]|uniref:5-formyltetrahydrofolate cyclo-ligase n=1 Tax=Mongoliitalea daihaiensis TaxID=2782006 RepID=UPI001F408B51|nr:5-formyltetrahydrofolate cyclo-ligase [Mongoliitalea daihaiensis]UJP66495.1 5-formyltetrahydrofolate cyclo-ligase [Mongoliitalea daihaiensis]
METKADIRNHFRKKRSVLTPEELADSSQKVFALFKQFLENHQERVHVHVFIPMKRNQEIDSYLLIEYLWSLDYKVYTSQMNYEKDQMDTVRFLPGSEVLLDKKGIPFPADQQPILAHNLQLVLVPLLAIDKAGNRLGYGKGYYDQFFSQVSSSDVYKLGISLFPPIESIPVEEHDIPLDACIYPQGVSYFTS